MRRDLSHSRRAVPAVGLRQGVDARSAAVQGRMTTGRTRALITPREHGAWGILLMPLVTGAVVGVHTFAGFVAVQGRMTTGRTRALITPREHGAWGILLMPLVTGAVVGVHTFAGFVAVFLFTLLALSLFWLRTPVESFLGIGPMRVQNDAESNA